jgi:tRNA threonylcarbamoyladenosine biosynthesis protein TsaB
MIVLALDTSTPSTAVGLRLDGGETLTAADHPARGERPGHQARLLPLAAGLLRRAGIAWDAVDRVAVGLGPGTYTGLRVGVATARALAQALGTEIVGISSLAALAYGALRERPCALVAVDARRHELFVAAYARWMPERAGELRSPPTAQRDSERGRVVTLSAPRAIDAAAFAALARQIVSEAPTGAGPRADVGWIAVGDGVAPHAADAAALGVAVPGAASALHRIDGGALCELAVSERAQQLARVVPQYCRLPDAELALRAAQRGAARVSAGAATAGAA